MGWDTAKAGTVAGATPSTTCCTARMACSQTTAANACVNGRKLKAVYCTSSAGTSASCDANCCEPDTTKCRFSGVVCPPNHYVDQAKWGATATPTNMTATCCTAKASCNLTYPAWPSMTISNGRPALLLLILAAC